MSIPAAPSELNMDAVEGVVTLLIEVFATGDPPIDRRELAEEVGHAVARELAADGTLDAALRLAVSRGLISEIANRGSVVRMWPVL